MLPPAIIFVNADITDGIKSVLTTQLFISESMTDKEFDARVAIDPNYPVNIHLQGLRIMVIRQDFHDLTNRTLADLVLFIKQGQATVEKNNFGPPGLSLPIARLNIYDLLRYNKSPYVFILPPSAIPPVGEDEEDEEQFGGGGIVAEELRSNNEIFDDGPDEDDNTDFINRK